jgi:signal transduction histidine kinase
MDAAGQIGVSDVRRIENSFRRAECFWAETSVNPLLIQLTHPPFSKVAEIIRSRADEITHEWDTAVREAMPQMRHLTFDELKDCAPQILEAIAGALGSDDPEVIRELLSRAPSQGLSRFRLNFDVAELMQQDRLWRAIIVLHVETQLGRQMDALESAALHAAVDMMLQRSVIALVEQQKSQLRAAAEKELKYLSFLSHDLNNHLYGVTLSLDELRCHLSSASGFDSAVESLVRAQNAIHTTVAGMRRLLDREMLRKSGEAPTFLPVDMHSLVTRIAEQFSQEANAKGISLAVEVRPGTVVMSDGELLSLVLQNLIGNGVKYSSGGIVRVGFDGAGEGGRPVIWVSDQGPGIDAEKIGHIFEAFERGEVHGQRGVGLGLCIASQAAKHLGAEVTVDSELGIGSTFRLKLERFARACCVGAAQGGADTTAGCKTV